MTRRLQNRHYLYFLLILSFLVSYCSGIMFCPRITRVAARGLKTRRANARQPCSLHRHLSLTKCNVSKNRVEKRNVHRVSNSTLKCSNPASNTNLWLELNQMRPPSMRLKSVLELQFGVQTAVSFDPLSPQTPTRQPWPGFIIFKFCTLNGLL